MNKRNGPLYEYILNMILEESALYYMLPLISFIYGAINESRHYNYDSTDAYGLESPDRKKCDTRRLLQCMKVLTRTLHTFNL